LFFMSCSATPSPGPDDPLRVDPEWQTETVLALARGIAAENAFDRLPILADALEESGCDNTAMLDHVRSAESHRVECWALRALLRTTLLLPGGVPIIFAYCPPGSFLMGSDHPEAAKFPDERPVHRVTLAKGFYAGIYPVTQAQWRAVMRTNPSEFVGDDRPVECVSWEDARAWCVMASELTARLIRLPMEAEWEYACRAGTTTEFHFGDMISDELVNYNASSTWNGSPQTSWRGETTTVGAFAPNSWGLFDCHGNVWEWCQDWFDKEHRGTNPAADWLGPDANQMDHVYRGGSWCSRPINCRSAFRGRGEAGNSGIHLGFRVVFTDG
jgi:formylglycine-generating enzyme required for sulfatase activity